MSLDKLKKKEEKSTKVLNRRTARDFNFPVKEKRTNEPNIERDLDGEKNRQCMLEAKNHIVGY